MTNEAILSPSITHYAGNMISDGRYTYSWDTMNRMTQSTDTQTGTVTEYAYGGMKRYLKKVVRSGALPEVTFFIGDHFELMPNGETRSYISAEFGEGAGMAIATVQTRSGSEVLHFTHSDHLGSSGVMTDSSGNIVELTSYFPFGELRHDLSSSEFVERHKFTGHEQDQETGLVYANARYYDSRIGRFVSGDPLQGRVEEMLGKFYILPQAINFYSYVANNPIKLVDLTGEDLFDIMNRPIISTHDSRQVRTLIGSTVSMLSLEITGQLYNHSLQEKPSNLHFGSQSYIASQIRSSVEYRDFVNKIIHSAEASNQSIYSEPFAGGSSINFRSGDLYSAIGGTHWSQVNANKNSNGDWNISMKIFDVYDFDYKAFAISGKLPFIAVNNFSVLDQDNGIIQNYDVSIELTDVFTPSNNTGTWGGASGGRWPWANRGNRNSP